MSVGGTKSVAILSIQSEFADAIYSKRKTYELRKSSFASEVVYVALYERELSAITGGFVVGRVIREGIGNLWSIVGEKATSKERFFDYFENYRSGVAIEIAEPEKFDDPITTEELNNLDSNFFIPASFNLLYVSPPILERLEEVSECLTTSIQSRKPRTLESWSNVEFRTLEDDEIEEFVTLSVQNIGEWYDDIDESFGRNIVESDRLGYDPNGYFTLTKRIHVLLEGGKKVGYTVVTEKRGGSIKFGPTIIHEEYQGHGIAQRMRRGLEDHYSRLGKRKSYSTIPATHFEAFRYLIKSGSSVEAFLRKQYSSYHDEIVVGRLFREGLPAGDWKLESQDAPRDLDLVDEVASPQQFQEFILKFMNPFYDEIDEKFVENILMAMQRFDPNNLGEKGKKVFSITDGERIYGTAICTLKRGGAVKIAPFLLNAPYREGELLLEGVEKFFASIDICRKLYTIIPVQDVLSIRLFIGFGYRPEGVLREPYKAGVDAIFLGKGLKGNSEEVL